MERLSRRKVLAAFVLTAVAVPAMAAAFSDVSSSTSYSTAIDALEARGIIDGYSDGTFKPKNRINRAEFLKIVLEGRGEDRTFTGEDCFPDVQNQWFAPYVCTAKSEDIIGGYPDGTFKPEQEINFVEAAKIVALAFGQDVQEGGEWYEGFVRALEDSAAIPPTVAGLSMAINRGEMAEIMWRLSEGRTDQASKGYMNLKYPEMRINVAAGVPQYAQTCADLQAYATEMGSAQQAMYKRGMIFEGAEDSFGAPVPAMAPQTGGSMDGAPANRDREESEASGDADYSDTNVQVAGVDEGDIVKTDGEHLYIVRNSGITIVRANGDMKVMSNTMFNTDDNFSPSTVYVDGDRLIAIGSGYRNIERPVPLMEKIAPDIWPSYPSYSQRTVAKIIDVSNPEQPRELRTLSFEGYEVSSRKIDDSLYLVMNQSLHPIIRPLAETRAQDILPAYSDSAVSTEDRPVGGCGDVVILPRVPSPQYLMVAKIPTGSTTEKVEVETVLGNAENVYMSTENLYVANTEWEYIWRAGQSGSNEKTSIFKFSVQDTGLDFESQGTVRGRILNQFSMDEHDNTFRIATTVGDLWNTQNPSMNNLYVLDADLKPLGSIEDIAPGEKIYSTRFMGDRAYMVTFRNVDPLFVIDTSNPRQPTILGKLKIPGYSDYLHPYDEHHILGFGKEAIPSKDDDSFAWYQGMKVALFDVTDVENPVEKAKVTIGDRGTESPLLHDHKALLFDKERNLLAFPVRIHEVAGKQSTTDPSTYGEATFQGAIVYSLTLSKGFEELGRITHYTSEDLLKSGSYFWGKDINRIVRIAESLLTVSEVGVQRHTFPGITYQEGVQYESNDTFGNENSCPDPSDEGVVYISKDPETCATIRFMCAEGKSAFHGDCGCGCKP
jgi:uncharacterized secreted protein with C-terminal beta-propeller domain